MDVALPCTLCVTDYIIFAVVVSSNFYVLYLFGLTGCYAMRACGLEPGGTNYTRRQVCWVTAFLNI